MLTHVSINLFPITMLLVIYMNNHKKASKRPDNIRFDILILFTLGLMLAGIMNYGLEGIPGKRANTGLWIFNAVYVWLIAGIASIWLVYISCRLEIWENEVYAKRIKRGMGVLHTLLGIFIATTPWTHLLFYITDENQYRAGKYLYLLYLASIILLLVSVLMIIRVYRQAVLPEQRTECCYLLGCSVPPLIGLALQYFLSEWWVSAPCLSLTILFVYLNAQNRQITTDELTGLNNRREFDKQILRRAEQENSGNWGMPMIDINNFKKINDSLGHLTGDEALWETADILRRTLGKEKLFLARYGGDEFAVIGEWSDGQEAHAAIAAVENETERFNREVGKAYKLSFAIGYAMANEVDGIEQLIEKADERMYLEKARKKSLMAKPD